MSPLAPPPSDSTPARMLPAWLFSLLFHFFAILILGLAIQPTPRGTAEEPGRSAGIVLKTTSAEGQLFEGEEEANNAAAHATADQSPPTDLLAALPNEPAPPSPLITSPQEQTPGAGPAAAPAGGGQLQLPNHGGARRGSLGGQGYANVTVFGVQGTGNKFVYLFDRSSSMEGAPLAAAKRQLIQSLDSLESVHQFHVIFFNTKTQAFDLTGGGNRIAFATDRNKKLAARFVDGVTADGGTDRLTALKYAVAFAPDVIFFLTDADDPMPASELDQIARLNSRAQAAICVIEFGRRQSPSPGNFLALLAQQSGGQYGYVNTSTLTRKVE